MSYFKLQHNGVDYPTRDYGGLNNLRRIMARNDDNFESYINLGNRTLPNQNALVNFLLMFSVNVEWTEDYLITVIDSKINQIASINDFVCVYNRGKNKIKSVYPEDNHNTLLVVPFGKPERSHINSYFNDELNSLVPLYPIYTTDVKQRWDIVGLYDTKTYKLASDAYTIIQVDVYALVIGFYRWLKLNRGVGESPHAYLLNFPIMNCYLYHNELVDFNYLNNEANVEIDNGQWVLENYRTQLTDYTDFKNRYMMTEQMKSFTQFFEINKGTNISVNTRKMIFPDSYKSSWFIQMSWAWTIGALGLARHYLTYNSFLGTVDGLFMSDIRKFYKYPLQSISGQIKDPKWQAHFISLYRDIATKI